MKHLLLRTLIPLLLAPLTQAQIPNHVQAEFTVLAGSANREKFIVYLDWQNRPVTTTNFMLLAGLADEVWTAPANLQVLTGVGLNFLSLDGTRPALRVAPIAGTNDFQVIRTDNVTRFSPVKLIGDPASELLEDSPTPQFSVKKGFINSGGQNVERFILTLEYKHPWFDNRTGLIRDTPFYKSTPNFTGVDNGVAGKRGKRIFAGSFTNFGGDGPGYVIPDEFFGLNASVANPWGQPFSMDFPFVLAMDNRGPNTAGSRFFITSTPAQSDDRWLGNYTPFGEVPNFIQANRSLVTKLTNAPDTVMNPISQNNNYRIEDIKFLIQGPAATDFFPHEWQKEILPTSPIPDTGNKTTIVSKGDQLTLKTVLDPLEQAAYLPSRNLLNPIGGLIYGLGNADNMPKSVETEVEFLRNPDFVSFSPQGFFQPYVLQHKLWPSLTYNQSNGLAGKNLFFTERPFLNRDPMAPLPDPVRVFRMTFNDQGTGGILNFGNINYEFGASYDGATSPYLGLVRLRDMPDVLPLEEIRLFFDVRITNPSQIRRFEAVEPEIEVEQPDLPPNIPPQPSILINPTFSGVWEDTNPN